MTAITDTSFARVWKSSIIRSPWSSDALTWSDIAYDSTMTLNEKIWTIWAQWPIWPKWDKGDTWATWTTWSTWATGAIGATWPQWRSIVTNVRTSGTWAPWTTDTYTITYSDSTTSTYNVWNGSNGTWIGDMLKSDNLSWLTDITAARTNIGITWTNTGDETAARINTILLNNTNVTVQASIPDTSYIPWVLPANTNPYKSTWLVIKGLIKTYLDTYYQPLAAVLTATTASYTTAIDTRLASTSWNNTGDETLATIKTKLGITTLSWSNTWDQTTTAWLANSTNKNLVTDAQLTVIGNTSWTNTGNETTTTIGTLINGATDKTTPVDADSVSIRDSVGWLMQKVSFTNIKAFLKTYFDTLYVALSSVSVSALANTIVKRDTNGYIFQNYVNTTADVTSTVPTHVAIQTSSDSWIRWQTASDFRRNMGQPRSVVETTNTTYTVNTDTTDMYCQTALASACTYGAPTWILKEGTKVIYRIKDNGTARALTWNASFRASSDLALPTTTIASKNLYLCFMANLTDWKWDLVALLNNV